MSNRRLGRRNRFEMIKNYKVPLICVIITCFLLVVSTVVITTLIRENNYYKEKLAQVEGSNNVVVGDNIDLSEDNKIQINQTMSYIMSNLTSGKSLNEEQAKYEITCKYFEKDYELDKIPDEYIDKIDAEVYREIGYVYFDDFKDEYMCISKEKYNDTYSKLFNIEKQNVSEMDKYYISAIDSYVVPKDNASKENSLYKVTNSIQDIVNKNTYKVTLSEINLYKLYEEKSYEEIEEYAKEITVSNEDLTGQTLNINMIKQGDIFVFDSYSGN
ncbi:MAG: hypothetical protein E7311_00320 [Clostridiales bacterium]|nr:hypothetical protein [Clostridiales bacterium]